MAMRPPQIVAMGGGGFSMEAGNPLIDDHILSLTGKDHPKVCFVPTASGDADHYIVRFYRTFSSVAETSHVSLFRRDKGAGAVEGDLEAHLLDQDLIYVGGGSVLSLLGAWKAHGVDHMMRKAWRRGAVMCGLSAGALCWFGEAVTAFHGPPEPLRGMNFLPFSACVHYDGEPCRREHFVSQIAAGMTPGYGIDDGAAIHFSGRELADVIGSRRGVGAYRVDPDGQGGATETRLEARYLGEPALSVVAA
jgi:dipeptidase E